MASKGKGKTKNAKKEKVVEEIPLVTDDKKDEELDEKQDEVATEEGTADELEPPKEPTPPPDYDEPTLAELIVERWLIEMLWVRKNYKSENGNKKLSNVLFVFASFQLIFQFVLYVLVLLIIIVLVLELGSGTDENDYQNIINDYVWPDMEEGIDDEYEDVCHVCAGILNLKQMLCLNIVPLFTDW